MRAGVNLYRVYDWDSHNFLECDENGIQLLKIFKEPHAIREGLEAFESQACQSLNTEQVCAKYLPQLQVAYQHKLLCLA
jgi:hypothetical protein